MSLSSGCQIEIKNLPTMRANVCHYCAILGMYAPCIVSYQTWNHDANMNHYCCTTDPKLFNANMLSVSNEAFLLLVLSIAAQGGCQKLTKKMVRNVFFVTDEEAMQSFPHTFVQCSQSNGTWTEDQELTMPVSVTVCIA